MEDAAIAAVMAPLALLAAYQLIGVRRLFSAEMAQVLGLGIGFAFIIMPLLSMLGVAAIEPSLDAFFQHGARVTRIWLILFGLVWAARLVIRVCRWLWRGRPRGAMTREG